MRLARVGDKGRERPAIVDGENRLRDLSSVIDDIDPATLSPKELDRLAQVKAEDLPLIPQESRIGSPIAGIGKVVCIGLNYHDHAAEVGKAPPAEPMLFMKASSSICGPNDPIEVPLSATKVDWEVELGVIIGTRAKNITAETAPEHVAGYVCANDVSERAFQSDRAGQFTKGKSHDTFCPLGPWLVTADELRDPNSLRLWTEVNGIMRQDGNTDDLIFDISTSIAYISQFMTLEPGDLILTGTPAGVGKGFEPDLIYLGVGDHFRCGVAGLGEQSHQMIEAQP